MTSEGVALRVPAQRTASRPRLLRARVRRLPLFWRLLLPYLTLIVLVGVLAAFLLVRNLTEQAEASLDAELTRRSLDARAAVQTRELSLLESGDFAANLQGMAAAARAADAGTAGRLLASVLALKADVALAAVTTADGTGLAQFQREGRAARPTPLASRTWGDTPFVQRVLADPSGRKEVGFLDLDGRRLLVLAAPVCGGTVRCDPVGAAVVGLPVQALAEAARGEGAAGESAAVFDTAGVLLASAGPSDGTTARRAGEEPVRRITGEGSGQRATLSSPLLLQGRELGTLEIALPTETAFSSVRPAAVRVALAVLAAMLGIVAIGALLSRSILRQLRPVLASVRAVGGGQLSARVAPQGQDEIGELADGFNAMAEQLQANYENLEARVEERTAEVQRLLAERTQVFAGISHELRTPVAIVLSQAQMLADTKVRKSAQWQADAGRVLEASGQQLLSFVSDVLELARSETERLDLELRDVPVQPLLSDLAVAVKALGAAHQVAVRVARVPDLPPVHADPERLRQVLLQLVDNAVKYTPPGGSVQLGAVQDGTCVRLSVSDTGIGIPAADVPRLFEPFYRVKTNHTQGGQASSGLGLAITRRLVEAQGGSVSVDSEVGRGTTVSVRLPVASPGR